MNAITTAVSIAIVLGYCALAVRRPGRPLTRGPESATWVVATFVLIGVTVMLAGPIVAGVSWLVALVTLTLLLEVKGR